MPPAKHAARDRKMAEMRASGETFAAIGAAFGVTDSTVQYALRRIGAERKPSGRPLTRMGQRYGDLVALYADPDWRDAHGQRRWVCWCVACNRIKTVRAGNLGKGACGCRRGSVRLPHWTVDEDDILRRHTAAECCRLLPHRSKLAIKVRRSRIGAAGKIGRPRRTPPDGAAGRD